MKILAIDPGNTESAYVLMREDYSLMLTPGGNSSGKLDNDFMLNMLKSTCTLYSSGLVDSSLTVVIEMVASYGMAVGKEVFDTCVWVGRFWQKAMESGSHRVELIYRMDEKMMICHDSRAKDTNIRQALIDRFAEFDKKNGKGTKQKPDWFYGFSKDVWMAYAVGVTFIDKEQQNVIQG